MKTNKDYLIKYYYDFMKKLYNVDSYPRNEEFEQRVNQQFGSNNDKDLDIDVTMLIKNDKGEEKKRKRSLYQFANFNTRAVPYNTTCITFYGEFVQIDENGKKLSNQKKKDRLAFKEQIFTVEMDNAKYIRKATNRSIKKLNPDVKIFEQNDIANFKGIIKFDNNKSL